MLSQPASPEVDAIAIVETVFLWVYVFEVAIRYFAYGFTRIGVPIGVYEDHHTGLPAYRA